MARQFKLSLACMLILSSTTFADEPKPSAIKPVQVKPRVKVVQVQAVTQVRAVTKAKAKPVATAAKAKPKVTLNKNSAAGKLQSLNKASKAQTEATIAYAKATAKARRLGQTAKKLKQALAADPDGVTDAQKKQLVAAEKALVKALQDVKTKQQAVVKAAAAAKAVAAQTVVIRRGYQPQAITVRKEVNAEKDDTERFMLLLPGGPLVIDATILVDGKSFRVQREELITQMLKFADRDEDGKATWVEAIKAPRFTMGRMRFTNDSQAASTIRMFDSNTNGLVDRVEVRQYIARYFNGPTFSLTANNYGQTRVFSNGRVVSSGGRQADVKTLLDTDKDGVLSEKEIAAASDRLKSRDADDNDLLYSSEVSGTATARGAYRSQVIRGGTVNRANSLYYLIGPTVSSDQIHNVLTQIYKDSEGKVLAESFAQVSELFKALDKNKNGVLDKDEAGALNSVKPRMTLLMEFNQKEGGKLTANGVVAKNNSTSVELPGIKISISASTGKPRVINYSQTAKSYMTRYDGDKNGYLEKKELTGNFARQFDLWDIDADGKVFEKEIAESYNLMQRPAQTQFRASIVNQGNPLFQTLDLSGDGRLSLREMRTAAKQVLKFDKNKDGRITANEIPQTIAITFSRGNAGYSYVRTGSALSGGRTGQPAAKPNQPAWFTRMDRNGDGDITLKEFLGEKADFEKLDTNKDGFIEPSEAKKTE